MDTVIIGWNPDTDTKKWNKFTKTMEKIFLSIDTDSFSTDSEHILFAHSKNEIDDRISGCSVLVCPEDIGDESMGNGTFKQWKQKAGDSLKVIAVLDSSRYGGGKCKGLYDNGFYDALFSKDFTLQGISSVISVPRTKEEAFEYYGLDGYQEKKPDKKTRTSRKKKPDEDDTAAGNDPGIKSADTGNALKIKKKDAPAVSEHDEAPENGRKPGKPAKENGKAAPSRKDGASTDGRAKDSRTAGKPADNPRKNNSKPDKKTPGEPKGASTAETAAKGGKTPGKAGKTDVKGNPADKTSGSKESKTKRKEPASGGASENVQKANHLTDAGDTASMGFMGPFMGPAEIVSKGNSSDGGKQEKKDRAVSAVHDEGFKKEENPDSGKKEKDKKPKEKLPESFFIFNESEDDLGKYLDACDNYAHSYEKVIPELTKTDKVLEDLVHYYTVENNTWMQNVKNDSSMKIQFDAELEQRIRNFGPDLTQGEFERVFDEFSRFLWRYDILEPYVLDKDISDIKVYDPWTVQIKYLGDKIAAPAVFRSAQHYNAFVGRVARKNHVDIQEKGMARFTDTLTYDDVRLRGNIATELLNSNGFPLLHFRKINNIKYTTQELINFKMMTKATAAYLIWCWRHKKSFVFCGKGSAGKTTIMNWLIDYFPLNMSALCIQEINELFSNTHPYIQFQEITSIKDLMGDSDKSSYDLRDLAINGLLTDIDAFFIGEIKGAEALQFTNSANTGNQVMASVHAENEQEALPQIADYSKFGSDYSRADLLKRLTSIDVVVFMEDFQVKSVSEVVGWNETTKDLVYKKVPIVVPEKPKKERKYGLGGDTGVIWTPEHLLTGTAFAA